MKTCLPLLIAFLLLLSTTDSEAQSYLWAEKGGGFGNTYGNYITSDDSGNVYAAGYFGDSAVFGNQMIYPVNPSPSNNGGSFIAKYNVLGKLKWVRLVNFLGNSIVVGKQGGLYTLGYNNNNNNNNYELAKYDTFGNLIWIRSANAAYEPTNLVLDSKENVYFAFIPKDTTIIIKYNSNGELSKNSIKISATIAAMATDAEQNIYITGTVGSGASTIGNITLKNKPVENAFTAKLDSSFNVLWVKGAVSKQISTATAIATDTKGHFYVTGLYFDTISFGGLSLNNPYNYDYYSYTACFDTSGAAKWIYNNITNYTPGGTSISCDSNGNAYFFDVNENFGKIYSYDMSGNLKWEVDNMLSSAYALGPNGIIYSTGYFGPQASFGTITLRASYYSDAFVAAFKDSALHFGNNKIRGAVFSDLNKNCIKDKNESGISGSVILAQPGAYFAVTDTAGNYILDIDTGVYTISEFKDITSYSIVNIQECPSHIGMYRVALKSSGIDTLGFNFADTTTNCPILTISLSTDTNNYRADGNSYQNHTMITYGNTGKVSAYNVIIKFIYPIGITVKSSSLPYISIEGSLVTYKIDTILPGASATFTMIDSIISWPPAEYTYGIGYSYEIVSYASIGSSDCDSIQNDSSYNNIPKQITVYPGVTSTVNPSSTTSLAGVSLYPNPTKGNFTLLFKEADSYQITVYNNLGEQVNATNINGTEANLNLDNATAGIYYVNIIGNKGSATKKLIVE